MSNNNQKQKPLSIALYDFKQGLINYISDAGIPPSIVELVLKDIYNQVKDAAQRELQQDMVEYQEQESQK